MEDPRLLALNTVPETGPLTPSRVRVSNSSDAALASMPTLEPASAGATTVRPMTTIPGLKRLSTIWTADPQPRRQLRTRPRLVPTPRRTWSSCLSKNALGEVTTFFGRADVSATAVVQQATSSAAATGIASASHQVRFEVQEGVISYSPKGTLEVAQEGNGRGESRSRVFLIKITSGGATLERIFETESAGDFSEIGELSPGLYEVSMVALGEGVLSPDGEDKGTAGFSFQFRVSGDTP